MTSLVLLLAVVGLIVGLPLTFLALASCFVGPTVLHYRSERPAGYRMLPRAVVR